MPGPDRASANTKRTGKNTRPIKLTFVSELFLSEKILNLRLLNEKLIEYIRASLR